MKLRERQDIGGLRRTPEIYGRSVLGLPLEVWRPKDACKLLVHAGIHGELVMLHLTAQQGVA